MVRIESGMDSVGTPRTRPQGVQSSAIEGVDRVPHGLVIAAQMLGNGDGAFASRTGQQDLAPAEHERIGGAQASLHLPALRVRHGTHKNRS
jgi:hypothetical protein